jgi:hypothetical protein
MKPREREVFFATPRRDLQDHRTVGQRGLGRQVYEDWEAAPRSGYQDEH